MDNYLQETRQLDYNNSNIETLIQTRGWNDLDDKEKILQIYDYVRDEIKFGYNLADTISASEVLEDGYGQCNTKSVLFMTLLRAVGVQCRFHGFTIDKRMQKGAISGIWYVLAPKEIIHSWVEVYYKQQWLNIEGFILDISYLEALQKKFSDVEGTFFGYGVATDDFRNPEIIWNESNTYIQKEGIAKDFGIYDEPDKFFAEHPQSLNPIKGFIYKNLTRHIMNRNVDYIRKSK